ncbi:Biogenesis of lysosome-related organelles complex 1 subunit 6 [Lonchura striata]|uniref:Biogenesis of lysosome-related organelles complex 1 subunit 6 n=1 Tax=Lonchura striata TaxID=40157 RepID=A0A218V7X2_9PASE|nr:Biogenesis of lysosome-related organelles complex 1 subunit 6 [Lonchura striata domestica]
MSGAERPEGKEAAEAAAVGDPGRSLAPSDASPDEGVVEDLPLIDEKAVEQLTEGLISHYLPDLQRSKSALQELTQNQVVLLETLEQEISKFKDCNSIVHINALFSEAKHYHNKLVNIRNEMMMLHEKTSKLKVKHLSCNKRGRRKNWNESSNVRRNLKERNS